MSVTCRGKRHVWSCTFMIGGTTYFRNLKDARNEEEAKQYEAEAMAAVRNGVLTWNPVLGDEGCRKGNLGAMSELMVCADLLKRGFDVYRSVTRTGLFDLIAAKNGIVCRVEVKTAHKLSQGGLSSRFRPNQIGTHDIAAYVLIREGKIQYSRDIQKWFDEKESA